MSSWMSPKRPQYRCSVGMILLLSQSGPHLPWQPDQHKAEGGHRQGGERQSQASGGWVANKKGQKLGADGSARQASAMQD